MNFRINTIRENDVVDSLNRLYILFQDEFVENPEKGYVSVVSNSHLVCNGRKGKRVITLPELYLLDKPEIKDIRVFINLLPSCASFHIVHYPESYDVFAIEWKDGPEKPYTGRGPSSTYSKRH